MGNETSSPLKLFLVTGSRADYGHLRSLAKKLGETSEICFSLLVTGSHLSQKFGYTFTEIEKDGFPIAAKFQLEMKSDSSEGISDAISEIIRQSSHFISSNSVDAVVLYGDRWEMLGVGIAATLAKKHIIHIGGGDVTEGAYDESFRHSLTKMSHLHFVTHDQAKQRVIQMGEDPNCVFNTGSLAIDSLKNVALLTKDDFESQTGFRLLRKNIIVTYHPTTLRDDCISEIDEVLGGFSALPDDIGILITQPSLDAGTLQMSAKVESWVSTRKNVKFVPSLGHQKYLSAISLFDASVGNSSSGLYEVPSFDKPTVNIGDRQGGRARASSVIDVNVNKEAISEAILHAVNLKLKGIRSPYGDGIAADKMKEILLRNRNWLKSLKKTFHCV